MPYRRQPDQHHEQPRPTVAIRLTRYGLPAAILLAGVLAAVILPGEAGLDVLVGLSGVCACVVLWNLLLRLGLSGDRDREREADARAFYDAHGRWPDERTTR
jgi:hypothetical protein